MINRASCNSAHTRSFARSYTDTQLAPHDTSHTFTMHAHTDALKLGQYNIFVPNGTMRPACVTEERTFERFVVGGVGYEGVVGLCKER